MAQRRRNSFPSTYSAVPVSAYHHHEAPGGYDANYNMTHGLYNFYDRLKDGTVALNQPTVNPNPGGYGGQNPMHHVTGQEYRDQLGYYVDDMGHPVVDGVPPVGATHQLLPWNAMPYAELTAAQEWKADHAKQAAANQYQQLLAQATQGKKKKKK